MNKQIMIKHYEATPKETLIDILVASREEVEKLQNKNKECKREIERLNNTINNTAIELEILLQSEDFELITMQLRNIVFRLKGTDKE